MQSALPATTPTPPATSERTGGPTDPSHDENLRRGVIATDVGRGVAWSLCLLFLATIYGLPLSQAYLEKRADEESPLLDLLHRAPTAENLHAVEKGIEDACYTKAFVQPRLQALLTRLGRVGNKLAVVGQGGWLFYTPGVRYVAGPGFLDRDVQKSREKEALDAGQDAIHADPRPAILAFHRALAERGIRLVVMPMPDKAEVQARELHGRGLSGRPQNIDYQRLTAELRQQGVAIFDAHESLPAVVEKPLFLAQDTHYTPAWMERVAGDLGRYLSGLGVLPSVEALQLRSVAQPVSRVGDLVDMLKLPEEQQIFSPQSVVVHQVQDAAGTAWEPDPKADILLLGDSFTNIFSLEGMGWGAAAGLGPQLALSLQRPLDVIAQNDSGAFATRQALARELEAGQDRLAGKRIVIWEFASRELAVGDWKPIKLPSSSSPSPAPNPEGPK
jgi:SGNH hydrolase-like domain, acetyltransferase AlgX